MNINIENEKSLIEKAFKKHKIICMKRVTDGSGFPEFGFMYIEEKNVIYKGPSGIMDLIFKTEIKTNRDETGVQMQVVSNPKEYDVQKILGYMDSKIEYSSTDILVSEGWIVD